MKNNTKSGLPLSRFAELAMRSAADEAEYVAGRKVAYSVTNGNGNSRRYTHRRPGPGRKPIPVYTDKDEEFASVTEAAEAMKVHKATITTAMRKGMRCCGRKFFRGKVV